MKRMLALLLCVAMLLSFPVIGNALESDSLKATTGREKLAAEIIKDIENLGTIAQDSLTELTVINQKLLNFGYLYGNDQYFFISNLELYQSAVEQYNALPKTQCLFGDANNDTAINAKDALDSLRASVGKVNLDHWQTYVADVNVDGTVNAKDALMVLQYTVGKLEEFPANKTLAEPFQQGENLYSVKSAELYQNTYQSMADRITETGYAQTSLTGAYDGMFCRDASIQVMAHIAEGDYDNARLILDFITDYHIENKYYYVIHIIYPETYASPSTVMQTDTTFFFLRAWVQFAENAPKTAKNKAYIEGSYSKIKEFANYYLDMGELDNEYGLLFNLNFEHTRDTSYWQSYDLLTNVYASQTYHEMAQYFKTLDPKNAKRWEEASAQIAQGVHKNLTVELDGALMYAELRGASHKSIYSDPEAEEKFIAGFSWVNLAPMSCDWYAADPEILEHTYQMYLKYGACTYYRTVLMLDACTNFNIKLLRPLRTGNHVIGKGLAWEILYCKKTGKTQRLAELASFVEEFSETMYRETWVYSGGGADTGNQEQASWLLVANKTAFPKLSAKSSSTYASASTATVAPTLTGTPLRVGTYNIHILTEANNDPAVIANVIRNNKVQVVGLQEVDNNTGRNGCTLDQAKALAEELGWYYGYSKAIPLGGGEYGNAILSQYPIESYKTINLTSGAEQRVMGHAVLNINGQKVNMLNTHLDTSSATRTTQINEIAKYVKNLNAYILTGDFNTSPTSLAPIGGTILRGSGIDNILLKNYDGGTPVVVNNSYSDHKMVYADITL